MFKIIAGSLSSIDVRLRSSSNQKSMLQRRTLQIYTNPMKRNRLVRDIVCYNDRVQHRQASLSLQHCQPQLHLTSKQPEARRLLSTSTASTGPSFFSSPMEWWRNRQETNELEKYKLRIAAMAEKDSWLIGDAIREIDESLNTWKAKVPGASTLSEIKMAKEMLKSLHGIAKVVGKEATEDILVKMSHKDKLVSAVNGETTLDSINTLIDQFRTMSLMQRALRKRKLEKKALPTTPEAVTALLQIEAPKLMSKEQKQKMGQEQAKRMMKRNR